MKHIKRFSEIIDILTEPRSSDPDEALMEYMTKMILIVLSLVTIPFFLISTAGWFRGFLPFDTMIFLFIMSLLFLTGWWLAHQGKWRMGSLFAPFILLAAGVYGNYVGGVDAPAMLLYVAAILLVAVVRGVWLMYSVLIISIISFVSLSMAHKYGFIVQVRNGETAFFNRIIIVISAITGISLLIRFIVAQYRAALLHERAEAAERKSVELTLRESEKQYRELVENANSIILRINMNGEIVFCNDFAERFFGYKSDELLGKKAVGTIVPEVDSSGKVLKSIIDDILKTPDNYRSNENENITKDGRRVWVNWANKPVLDIEGRYVEILCIGNDITEQKRAFEEREKIQGQLIQAQKMEAVGSLTSGLAHDFNNILSGIMGSLSLLSFLLRNADFSGKEESEKYIQVAFDSSKRASDLIKKLLILSRRREVKLVPVDISKSISHVIEICRNSFPKSILIKTVYSAAHVNVMADSVLVEQLFLNFCVNASHAMTLMREPGDKEGGTLEVRVSRRERVADTSLNTETSDGQMCFAVIEIEDTGVGMDSETQKKIFEPFFTMKKKEEGTGLGLSMAYSIIHQLGGFIEIESEINRGSLFRIFIPELKNAEESDTSAGSDDYLVRGSGTILIVDDELPVLAVAEGTLKSCGYMVLKAFDGVEGLSLFSMHRDEISAVLLDISMPFMSGFEVFSKMKEIDDTVRVILSSGLSDDVRISELLADGSVEFLHKPYTAVELSKKISELLQDKI